MKQIKQLYKIAKEAKVGDNCICPICSTQFVKSNYQQAFCKSKPGTICKDKYWNTVTPGKRNNTTRISPANAKWQAKSLYHTTSNFVGYSQAELDKIDREKNELNFEGDEQGGNVYVDRCEFCGCIDCRCDYFVSSFDY